LGYPKYFEKEKICALRGQCRGKT